MSKIYLVRHGTTEFNVANRLRGWADVPLNEQGRKEAVDLGKWFKDKPIKDIYSSDLQRAVSTSHEIARNTKAPVANLAALRPINFGEWNGQKMDEVGPKMEELRKDWETQPDKPAPKGESFSSFQDRQIAIFENVLKTLKPKDQVVLSAHLRNMNYLTDYVKNGRKPLSGKKINGLNVEKDIPASITTIDYNPEKDLAKVEKENYQDDFGK